MTRLAAFPCDGGTNQELHPIPAFSFLAPATRMLLSADGSTTALLQALISGPLTVRVLGQSVTQARYVPENARHALLLGEDAQVLDRRSALVDEELRTVSVNHVVTLHAPQSQLGGIASGTSAIGPQLSKHRVEHHRELIACGVGLWPEAPEPLAAAVKAYVIYSGGAPLIFIRETFNPAIVPPATDGLTEISSYG
jgi:3-deoxy-7-phosphoheptulonate synthase